MAVTVSASELHRVVSTAIIHRRGKYLLLKRSEKEKAFPGKWTVPGGGLSPEDYVNSPKSTFAGQWYFAVEKSLRREIEEETNVTVGELQYLCDLVFVRPDKVPVVVLSFFAPWEAGKVKLQDEMLVEFAWVTAKEAKKYDLIAGILEEIMIVDLMLNRKDLGRGGKERLFLKLLKQNTK